MVASRVFKMETLAIPLLLDVLEGIAVISVADDGVFVVVDDALLEALCLFVSEAVKVMIVFELLSAVL